MDKKVSINREVPVSVKDQAGLDGGHPGGVIEGTLWLPSSLEIYLAQQITKLSQLLWNNSNFSL